MTISEAQKRSVTRGDTEALESGGDYASPVWFFLAPWGSPGDGTPDLLPLDLPAYWTRERDALLRSTLRESMWGSVIYKAASRIAAFGWNLNDAALSTLRVRRAQDLLHAADAGDGWVQFITKVVKDYTCTDNGAFVEVIRASGAAGSRVIGIRHLDSLRCWRTGDPARPVVYLDLWGRPHLLQAHQVLALVDMPAADVRLRGVGQCAADRAYPSIRKLAYLDRYIVEKLAGTRPLAVYFVNGINREQLSAALSHGKQEALSQGFVTYMGATIVPTMRPEAPEVSKIDLAGLPERVEVREERSAAYLHYAHAIGMAVQEIEPLSGQGLGTGTQTIVLDEAARGQGLASFIAQWEHKISRDVLPSSTTFAFVNTDDKREQKAKAEITKLRVETRAAQLQSGELKGADEARQLAADAGDIPPSFLATDETPTDSASDNEKVLSDAERAAVGAEVEDPGGEVDAETLAAVGTALKAVAADVEAILDEEDESATALYRAIVRRRKARAA